MDADRSADVQVKAAVDLYTVMPLTRTNSWLVNPYVFIHNLYQSTRIGFLDNDSKI